MSSCERCGWQIPTEGEYAFCAECGNSFQPAAEREDQWNEETVAEHQTRERRASLTEDVLSTLLEVASIRRAVGRNSQPAESERASHPTSAPTASQFDRVSDTREFDGTRTTDWKMPPPASAMRDSSRPSSTVFAARGAGDREELPDDDGEEEQNDERGGDAHDAALATHDAPLRTIAESLEQLCHRSDIATQGRACVVDLLTLVASADGDIDAEEMEALQKALAVLIGGDPLPEVVEMLIGSSLDGIRREGRERRMLSVATSLRECGAEEEGLHVAIAIAYASYGFSAAERAVIESLAHATGVPATRLAAIVRAVRAEVDPG